MTADKNKVSLELAHRLSERVNAAWESGEMLQKVTPITAELLRFWFDPGYCTTREKNFHSGQRQAILNIIYLHEVVGEKRVLDAYEAVAPDLLPVADLAQLGKDKYSFPKYAIKMATGTGKTWVMHALIIWQLLNARHEAERSGRFTQRFLIVAPGLIVYERLLDAFCGRQTDVESPRSAETNDYALNSELFLPPQFRDEVSSFVQTNTVAKEDIGRKVTGEGLIALTNWHLFIDSEEEEEEEEAEEEEYDMVAEDGDSYDTSPQAIVHGVMPIRPGKTAGNDIEVLDRRYLRRTAIDFLASLPDLMVINDEAHHIHEVKRAGETEELEWQRGLNMVREHKETFFQMDFSATPYDMRGTAKKHSDVYFPHIVVDFDLAHAIRQGLVKLLLFDKRENLTELPELDFRAVREGRRIIGLSEGQRVMLRAGLTKLRMLEKDFTATDKEKYPKMLVVCEETPVSDFVQDFLCEEGLSNDDMVIIDSSRKKDVSPKEWKRLKADLFNIDHRAKPKVIISVMMLREGFDVSNICVLVALRKAGSDILVEQLIGRGLRLMWREPEYQEQKESDRKLILDEHKKTPGSYIDTLSIVEHPAFLSFYDDLVEKGLIAADTSTPGSVKAMGDIITVGLRDDYQDYDFAWPSIIHDAEEEIADKDIDITTMQPFTAYSLEKLRQFLARDGETFVSQEALTLTTIGKYTVKADLFNAETYNEYLQKILRVVSVRPNNARRRSLPLMQINSARVVAALDMYIRTRLFGRPFNPFNGSDWKILLAQNGIVTKHIVRELSSAIRRMQTDSEKFPAEAELTPFSSVATMRMREKHSVAVRKCIYERVGIATNGGGLEKSFIDFLEKDGSVQSFLKISESAHPFATICYFRSDGLPAPYFPDFLVKTAEGIFLVETKADNMVDDKNVVQKKKAATEWVDRVNKLPAKERMDHEWEYLLLKETQFYSLQGGGATFSDIADHCRVTTSMAYGRLF